MFCQWLFITSRPPDSRGMPWMTSKWIAFTHWSKLCVSDSSTTDVLRVKDPGASGSAGITRSTYPLPDNAGGMYSASQV